MRNVLRSKLLDRNELQASLRGTPQAWRDDSQALANHLVRIGKLTRFQANKLLRGITQGMIVGDYRVLAPIGKGAMGTVFLVRDMRSNQLMALKILPPRLARSEERMVARFRREMELSRLVSHPNLAWTHEVGEWKGIPYIALEYIPGKTLYRLVIDEGRLPLPRAARLMAEVAAGLEHAHNRGLIHRDLKPSNIIVTPHDHAKVLDLGLALIHGEKGTDARVIGGQGYVVGTMDYVAPEQTYNAATVDRRSDLYSLGCTLYFLLTGQPPFPGGTSKEKALRHRSEKPRPLAELAPELPPRFIEFVERLMSKNPDDRPQSAAQVEHELRQWATGEVDQPYDNLSAIAFDEALLPTQRSDGTLDSLPPQELFSTVESSELLDPVLPAEKDYNGWLIPLVVGLTVVVLGMAFVVILLAMRLS